MSRARFVDPLPSSRLPATRLLSVELSSAMPYVCMGEAWVSKQRLFVTTLFAHVFELCSNTMPERRFGLELLRPLPSAVLPSQTQSLESSIRMPVPLLADAMLAEIEIPRAP